MSYILDALRKLEQNRQHEESLAFLTFQGQAPRKRKRHRLWPYLLIGVLMLNAGAIFWWIVPWQSPGKKMTAEPLAVREVKPAIPIAAPAADGVQSQESAGKTIVATKEVKERSRTAERDIVATTRPAARQAPVAKEASVPFEKSSLPAPPVRVDSTPPEEPSPAPPIRAEVTPPADARVLKPADLPASIAGGLPEFKISFHYYIAEPRSRVVWINDRTLHEGEYLSEGLKVEQINERSVVMNYRGWRFQLELNR